jgi:hypothetical protein
MNGVRVLVVGIEADRLARPGSVIVSYDRVVSNTFSLQSGQHAEAERMRLQNRSSNGPNKPRKLLVYKLSTSPDAVKSASAEN